MRSSRELMVVYCEGGRRGLGRNREAEMGEWLLAVTYHLQAGEVVVALDEGGVGSRDS